MRIRKHVRRASAGFPAGETQVFGVWKLGWDRDCELSMQHGGGGAAGSVAPAAQEEAEESSWLDFLTMSKHSCIHNDDLGHGLGPDHGAEADECAEPESVCENSSGVGDLNLVMKLEQVDIMQSPAAEHVTRHYVRRRRDGHGGGGAAIAAPVQCHCAHADLDAAQKSAGKVRTL